MFHRKIKVVLFILSSILCSLVALAGTEHSELKAFPDAGDGMERYVIVLPQMQEKETLLKVELIPGRVMVTDGANLIQLGITIEPRTLKGWGYTYYEVIGSDLVMSTMMAPPPGATEIEKFVAGPSLTVRYNSRLPIVIYAPENYEIRYRIWEASAQLKKVEKQ